MEGKIGLAKYYQEFSASTAEILEMEKVLSAGGGRIGRNSTDGKFNYGIYYRRNIPRSVNELSVIRLGRVIDGQGVQNLWHSEPVSQKDIESLFGNFDEGEDGERGWSENLSIYVKRVDVIRALRLIDAVVSQGDSGNEERIEKAFEFVRDWIGKDGFGIAAARYLQGTL